MSIWKEFSVPKDNKRAHRRDCNHCAEDICRDLKTGISHFNKCNKYKGDFFDEKGEPKPGSRKEEK